MDNDETFPEMGDDELDVAPEPAPQDTSQQAEYWRKRAERAEKQAVERKVSLRRYEAASKHGVTPEQIPDWVPIDKMDEFVSLLPKPEPTAPSPTEAASEEAPEVEVPAGLAAVAGASAPPASSPGPTLSATEIRDLMVRDPAAGIRAAQAKYGGTH